MEERILDDGGFCRLATDTDGGAGVVVLGLLTLTTEHVGIGDFDRLG